MFLYGFSSCTCLYELLSILFLWVFVMYMLLRMTLHFLVYGFSSCTFLYEWLSILFFYGFSSCTFLYEWLSIFLWVFVIYISVRMTIHFFVYGFLSCTWKWIVICTDMYMTKTHKNNMDSHSYKHVHDEKPLKRNG